MGPYGCKRDYCVVLFRQPYFFFLIFLLSYSLATAKALGEDSKGTDLIKKIFVAFVDRNTVDMKVCLIIDNLF